MASLLRQIQLENTDTSILSCWFKLGWDDLESLDAYFLTLFFGVKPDERCLFSLQEPKGL